MGAIFFSQRKPRGFSYKPRFYDPDAEEREERKRVVLGDRYESKSEAEYVPGSLIREHVSSRRGGVADAMRKRRKKTASIPILVAVLVVIGYLVWRWYFS